MINPKFKSIAVLFSGGVSLNIPPTANTAKNPPIPIATIKAITAYGNQFLLDQDNLFNMDLEGSNLKVVKSFIKKDNKNNIDPVIKISVPNNLLKPFGFIKNKTITKTINKNKNVIKIL